MNTTDENREYCKQLSIYSQNFLNRLLMDDVEYDMDCDFNECRIYFRSAKLHAVVSVGYKYDYIKQLCEHAGARPRHYERLHICIQEHQPELNLVKFDPLWEGI